MKEHKINEHKKRTILLAPHHLRFREDLARWNNISIAEVTRQSIELWWQTEAKKQGVYNEREFVNLITGREIL